MALGPLAAIACFAAIGAYVQTLTGFAFGLIMMASIALVGLLPLPDAAAMVGMLTLVNATQMLIQGGWREVARRELRLILAASLPALLVGYALLEWMADTRADLLKIGLGLVIMLSSLQLAIRPASLVKRSSDASFVGFGIVSGLMSGLFATGGPPLVYHLFRQPFPHERIRETLVAAFGAAQLVRLAMVVASGNLPGMLPAALDLCRAPLAARSVAANDAQGRFCPAFPVGPVAGAACRHAYRRLTARCKCRLSKPNHSRRLQIGNPSDARELRASGSISERSDSHPIETGEPCLESVVAGKLPRRCP